MMYITMKFRTYKGRKAPRESATEFRKGVSKRGIDGNMWEIRITCNGVKRWALKSSNRGGAKRKAASKRQSKATPRRSGRKAPGSSATLYGAGTMRKGLNGKMWVVRKASNGVKRWVPSSGKKTASKRKPHTKKKPTSKSKPAKKSAAKKKKPASKRKPAKKPAGTRAKASRGRHTTMTKAAIIATFPDIKRLPKDREFDCWTCEERLVADVRKYYGSRATLLTVALAKRLLPQTVQVLMGQKWSAMYKADRSERVKNLETLELLRFNDETEELTVRSRGKWGSTFELYEYDGDLVSGSGADPVYVFLAK
jgi:hypothetical protein